MKTFGDFAVGPDGSAHGVGVHVPPHRSACGGLHIKPSPNRIGLVAFCAIGGVDSLTAETFFGALLLSSLRTPRVRRAVVALFCCFLCGCDRDPQRAAQHPPSVDSPTNAVASVTPVSAQGAAVCREATWDFGTVDQTKTPELSHTFTVENVSTELVKIAKVESECGCVVAREYPAEIPASSAGEFSVAVQLAGRPRPLQKRVTIHLAAPTPSKLTLTIRGNVDASPAFYSTPETVDFGTLAQSETKSRVVKIARFDASPVRFVHGVPQSAAVSLDSAAPGDDVDSFIALTISLDSSLLRAGDFTSSLAVRAEHSTHGEFVIPIKARVAGAPDGLVRSVFARHLRRGTFQDISLLPDGASAAVEEVSYEGEAPIAVEATAGPGKGSTDAPAVRISRTDEGPREGKPRVVGGRLFVTLAGQTSPVPIPIFVQLTD